LENGLVRMEKNYKYPSGYAPSIYLNPREWDAWPFGKNLNFQDFEISGLSDILSFLRKKEQSHELCLKYHDNSILHIPLDYLKPIDSRLYAENLRETRKDIGIVRETKITKKIFPYIDFERSLVQGNFFGIDVENFKEAFYIEKASQIEENYSLQNIKNIFAEDTWIREYFPEFVHCLSVEDPSIIRDDSWGCLLEEEFNHEIKKGPFIDLNINDKFKRLYYEEDFMPEHQAREMYNPIKEDIEIKTSCTQINIDHFFINLEIKFPYEFIDEFRDHLAFSELRRGTDQWRGQSQFSQEQAYNIILDNPNFFWDTFNLSKRIYQLALETENHNLEYTINTLNHHLYHSDDEMDMHFEEYPHFLFFQWKVSNPEYIFPSINIKKPVSKEKRINRPVKLGDVLENLTIPLLR